MELFQDVIQGPYTLLLIFQILIVSGLLLGLITLFVRRVKGDSVTAQPRVTEAAAPAAVTQPAAPTTARIEPQAPAAPEPTVAQSAPQATDAVEAPKPETPAPTLANEDELKKMLEESTTLKEKIKYLESRLMEYEIVQEEISTLGQLRTENEKLKEELSKLKGGASPESSPEGVAAPQAPSEATETPQPPPEPSEAPSAPKIDVAQGQVDSILEKLDEITPK